MLFRYINYKNIANLHLKAINNSKNISDADKNMHLNQAVEYAEKSYKLAKEINYLPLVTLSCSTLQNVWNEIGNPANSKKYKEIYATTKDSIQKSNKTQLVAEANISSQSDDKNINGVQEISYTKTILFVLFGVVILLLLFTLIKLRKV